MAKARVAHGGARDAGEERAVAFGRAPKSLWRAVAPDADMLDMGVRGRMELGRLVALPAPVGSAELVANAEHFRRIVTDGILKARVSVDIMTADFKAMLIPTPLSRRAPSIVESFRRLALGGVEIRLLHASTPSSAALRELKKSLPAGLTIRRCPRLHAKAVIIDSCAMYLGSANLTGAGLGAKADGRRNFELGIWTSEPSLIDAVVDHFNALWDGSCCTRCRRKDICPVPLEEPSL